MKEAVCMIYVIGIVSAVGSSYPILAHAQTEESSVKVMTFNVLQGGTQRGQPLSQTAKVIQDAKADVVGLQEIGDNAEVLAKLLGWNHVSHGRRAILTHYDIVESHIDGIKVKLNSGQEAYIFNLHLKPAPYQPYQLMNIPYGNAPFIKTEQEAIASAGTARGEQIATLLQQIRALQGVDLPIFVTGDFNEPSHLDWTEAAAKSGRHPIKVAYPGSMTMAKAGFIDAWRAVHTDEVKKSGFTWTPLTKPEDPKDHHDRIDFVYFRGKDIELKGVSIVGEEKDNADIVVSPYPSDHRAVVASFTLSKRSESGNTDANKANAGDGK